MSKAAEPTGSLGVALGHAQRLLEREARLAAAQATEILKVAPGHPRALPILGAALRIAGQTQAALEVLEPLARPDGVFSYVWAPVGTHLPITPDFKGSLVARFNLNPIGKWEPHIQGNWTYQSSASVQLRVDQSAVVGAMPAYALVDLRMGATADKLTGELYITNLFDRLAQLSRFTQTAPTLSDTSPRPVDTQPYIIPAQPCTIGLKVAMRF